LKGGVRKMVMNANKNRIGLVRKDAIPLTLTNLVIFTVLALIFFQLIGLVFRIGSIKLGPIFILIAIGMSAAMGIAAFRKVASDHLELTKKDVFAIIITAVIALVLMFFLRDFVPEIFEAGIDQMQSMIGL
jgi:uncharacterized membrane protein